MYMYLHVLSVISLQPSHLTASVISVVLTKPPHLKIVLLITNLKRNSLKHCGYVDISRDSMGGGSECIVGLCRGSRTPPWAR